MRFVYISAYNLTHAMNSGQDQMDAPETSGMRRQKKFLPVTSLERESLASILSHPYQQQAITVQIAFVKAPTVPQSPVR